MIPEIGLFALILALCVSLAQAALPIAGALKGVSGWTALARPAAYTQFLFVAISYACLTWSFIVNDFTVVYVASTSNSLLPLLYRISGVWGAHEGSMLLWVLILALWTAAVARFSRGMPESQSALVIGVMGLISVGFLLFVLFTSNPFERLLPAAAEGRDLNPLLQDVGLAIHPPMLYMGYVGFSVAFAFAIAAMLSGRLDVAWARWSRPWTHVAWLFLTAGIALGSWWAYYELGWGGWWFWDPVENASFMPWLVGTALMHSLAATEQRGVFKAWTVLLAVFAFSLSLLGTFLVRSGVLTSVHAFATDPARGVFILIFLVAVIGGSLVLYAWRAPRIRSSTGFEPVSRETGILLNNLLLAVLTATILLGTLYPLVMEALELGKISVGPPYFNRVFVPLAVPLALLVGVGALARWKRDSLMEIVGRLRWQAAISIVGGIALPWIYGGRFSAAASLGCGLGLWVALTAWQAVRERLRHRSLSLPALAALPRGFWGMILGHLGIGVFAVGVAMVSNFELEKDVRMAPGETYAMEGWEFRFLGTKPTEGPNYRAQQGIVEVSRGGKRVADLRPQKRVYLSGNQPMTEAAIDWGITRDVYVSLGEPLEKDNAWTIRLHVKPFVRWIWFGAIFMTLGGLLASTDRRYRRSARAAESLPVGAAPAQR